MIENYIVMGSEGFIGSALISHLSLDDNLQILGIGSAGTFLNKKPYPGINLLNPDHVQKMIDELKPKYVFHFAAKSSIVNSWNSPIEHISHNFQITQNVVRAIREKSPGSKLVYFSSSAVYARKGSPLIEHDFLGPDSPYGISKLMSEMAVSSLDNYLVIRPFFVVGHGKKHDLMDDWISQLIAVKESANPELEVGNLGVVRDFLYIDDAIELIMHIVTLSTHNGIYNLCSGEPVELREILARLIKVSGFEGITIRENSSNKLRHSDREYVVGSTKKIKSLGSLSLDFNSFDYLKHMYEQSLNKLQKS